jgi:hypothetical protein
MTAARGCVIFTCEVEPAITWSTPGEEEEVQGRMRRSKKEKRWGVGGEKKRKCLKVAFFDRFGSYKMRPC